MPNMTHENAIDLVDATTKALKAAVAVHSAKGAGVIPHAVGLVQQARGAWLDAIENESTCYAASHPDDTSLLPQETLRLDAVAPRGVDPESEAVPPLEAQGRAFYETQAHDDLPPARQEFPEMEAPALEGEFDDASGAVGA